MDNNYNTAFISGYDNVGGIAGLFSYYYTGVVAVNISLGSSLSAESSGARVYCGSGPNSNNKARSDMVLTIAGVPVQNSPYGNDGLAVAIGTAQSSVFEYLDTSIWSIPNGNLSVNSALPTLHGMPPGAQNPVLLP